MAKLAPDKPRPVVTIVPSTTEHVRELANCLRAMDKIELDKVYGFPPHKALWRCFKGSFLRHTAFIDGKLAAMWGVGGTLMGQVGNPWLMTTDEVYKIPPLLFARTYQHEVLRMLKLFPVLTNYVDADYEAAIRLLDIIGFKLGEPELVGVHGEPFIKFEMKR